MHQETPNMVVEIRVVEFGSVSAAVAARAIGALDAFGA
jgi:hypothetical protein